MDICLITEHLEITKRFEVSPPVLQFEGIGSDRNALYLRIDRQSVVLLERLPPLGLTSRDQLGIVLGPLDPDNPEGIFFVEGFQLIKSIMDVGALIFPDHRKNTNSIQILPDQISRDAFSFRDIRLGLTEALDQFVGGTSQYKMDVQKCLPGCLTRCRRAVVFCVLFFLGTGEKEENTTNH